MCCICEEIGVARIKVCSQLELCTAGKAFTKNARWKPIMPAREADVKNSRTIATANPHPHLELWDLDNLHPQQRFPIRFYFEGGRLARSTILGGGGDSGRDSSGNSDIVRAGHNLSVFVKAFPAVQSSM